MIRLHDSEHILAVIIISRGLDFGERSWYLASGVVLGSSC
jgi:hypothetical protein